MIDANRFLADLHQLRSFGATGTGVVPAWFCWPLKVTIISR